MATLSPRAFSIRPIAATVSPLPTELTTPPVQKIYWGLEVTCSTYLQFLRPLPAGIQSR